MSYIEAEDEDEGLFTEFDLSFDGEQVLVRVIHSGGASVETTLHQDTRAAESEGDWTEYNAAIDGLEAFLLALAGEDILGFNPETREKFRRALKTAVEAIANNLAP